MNCNQLLLVFIIFLIWFFCEVTLVLPFLKLEWGKKMDILLKQDHSSREEICRDLCIYIFCVNNVVLA